jgi:hypothetical protein
MLSLHGVDVDKAAFNETAYPSNKTARVGEGREVDEAHSPGLLKPAMGFLRRLIEAPMEVDKKAILLVIAVFALPPVNAIVGWDWNETPVGAVPQLQLYYPKSTHIVPEESAKAWEAFLDRYGANWRAEWDAETGAPVEISGYRYDYDAGRPVSTEGEAEATAWRFISDIQGLLKVDASDLALERISDLGEAGWRVVYRQHVEGVPVYNARVVVLMTRDGEIDGLRNTFLPGIEVSVEPLVPREAAIETAKKAYIEEFNVLEPWAEGSELVILPRYENGSLLYQLAWKVDMSSGSWRKRYFVDAAEGGIIGGQDMAVTGFAGGLPARDAPNMSNIALLLIGALAASLILSAVIRRMGRRIPP